MAGRSPTPYMRQDEFGALADMFFPAELKRDALSASGGELPARLRPLMERLDSAGMGQTQREAVSEAARALEAGEIVVVVDEEGADGRGRGFMLGAAALASTPSVNTMVTWGRGLTCFSVTAEKAMALGLVLAGEYREGYRGPIFLRSVEAAECDGTGISAADRALTLRAAGAADAGIASLKSPGHVMPAMIAYRGREHRASADIALDLVLHLTTYEVAAWTDILDDDGEVASGEYCESLAVRLGLACLRLEDAFGSEALGPA